MIRYLYDVFGLRVCSPHPYRFLPAAVGRSSDREVEIRHAEVPHALQAPVASDDMPQADAHMEVGRQGEVLWITPHGRFLAIGGTEILMSPTGCGTRPAAMLRFVFSNCLPAILIQRGQLALHANTVATPNGAVAIGGASGAGKSTLMAAMLANGCPMLSDDVAAIRLDTAHRPVTAAGSYQYRLCADAMQKITPAAERMRSAGGTRSKVVVTVPPQSFHPQPASLRAIYLLEVHDQDEVSIDTLSGAHKLAALRTASYAPLHVTHLSSQIQALAEIASTVPVHKIRRPRSRWTVEQLVEMINQQPHGAQQCCPA